MTLEQELLTILNQIPAAIEKAFTEALVLRHPGHPNQKTHGNRFGAGQAKESLRRLKGDKGAREAYKQGHRERTAARRQQFSNDIDTQGKINALGDRQSLLQRQVDTENLKPKYRKEKQAEMKKIQGEIDALKASRDAARNKTTKPKKNVFSPVNTLNRQRAGAVDFAKMLQARGQDLGQIHKEIADIESRIKSLGGKIKF